MARFNGKGCAFNQEAMLNMVAQFADVPLLKTFCEAIVKGDRGAMVSAVNDGVTGTAAAQSIGAEASYASQDAAVANTQSVANVSNAPEAVGRSA